MRKANMKRPTCEECGMIDLLPENAFAFWAFGKYNNLIVIRTGFGWSINVEAVKLVADKYDMDDYLDLANDFSVMMAEYNKDGSEEK